MASRQREHQRKLREQGKCVCCGKPAEPSTRKGGNGFSTFCLVHLIASRERKHKTHNSRRNTNSPSYKREELAKIVAEAPFEAPQWAQDAIKEDVDKVEEPEFFYQIQGVDGR